MKQSGLNVRPTGLRSRFGYPVPPSDLAPSPGAIAAAKALGKTASTTSWTQVRGGNIFYPFAHFVTVSVPADMVLHVAANAVDQGADPYLAAFYKSIGSGNANAYWVNFVGVNDDRGDGTLNSYIAWRNATGSAKTVRLVSFVYPQTQGTTTLAWRILNNGTTFTSGSHTFWVGAAPHFDVEVPSDYAGCVGPMASNLTLNLDPTRTQQTHYGSSVLAVNTATMEGAYLKDTSYGLRLNDVLPGYPSFVVGYFEGDGFQPNMIFPDEALKELNDHYHNPYYQWSETDEFSCP